MLGKLSSEFLPIIQRCRFITELKTINTLRCSSSKREYVKLSTSHARINESVVEEELRTIFKFKDTKLSNWIVENKAYALCAKYTESNKEDRQRILRTLASQYAVQRDCVCQTANKYLACKSEDKEYIVHERMLRNVLTPAYHWLFVIIGRLQHGVKFLVNLRTDVLELLSEMEGNDETIMIQQLNNTLQNLLLLWFSVGFLHLERVTLESASDIVQKISDYEVIYPLKNWSEVKRRFGPYRRCYMFTHPSMPREPLVLLHTALCDVIPATVEGIDEAQTRILGSAKKNVTFLEEDKSKITAGIFYSVASTQKGLQGFELGNYLIKEVANAITTEFPAVHLLSSLSPIPYFKSWLIGKLKQDVAFVFTAQESEVLKNILKTEDVVSALNKVLNNSLWIDDKQLSQFLKEPLLRACTWYLYKEKRRGYAFNNVANFHLRNGAMMWRINWMANPSSIALASSCGIMVNYRYFLDKCEANSRNYIENFVISASEDVINLARLAETSRSCNTL